MAEYAVRVSGLAKFVIILPVEADSPIEAADWLSKNGISVADIEDRQGLYGVQEWGVLEASLVPGSEVKHSAPYETLPTKAEIKRAAKEIHDACNAAEAEHGAEDAWEAALTNSPTEEKAGQPAQPYDSLIDMDPAYINRKLVELQKRIEYLEQVEAGGKL